MKASILLLALSVLAFSSCTTAYKTGQTPDDVYFSPVPPQEEYVQAEEKEEYRYDDQYYDDRYLRMKVRNRYRWSDLDEWYYYDRYSVGYNYYYGSYNNPYNNWNYIYNPYCCCHNNSPKANHWQPPVKTRYFSLAGYTNTQYNNNNTGSAIKTPVRTTRPVYNNTNNTNGLSNKVRTIFSNEENNTPSRSYTPSSNSSGNNTSSGSSGSSGKSGTSGSSGSGVTRPVRN